jgi:hypothetical protein
MKLQDIDNLQEKCDYLQNHLINAKERAIESDNNISDDETDSIIRSSIIDINKSFIPNELEPEKNQVIEHDYLYLSDLKAILFKIDGIPDHKRKLKTRKREIVLSRQIVMAIYHRTFKAVSLAKAGRLYNKDHATVLHACKAIRNLRETDSAFELEYKEIWDWAMKHNPKFSLVD